MRLRKFFATVNKVCGAAGMVFSGMKLDNVGGRLLRPFGGTLYREDWESISQQADILPDTAKNLRKFDSSVKSA